ncbi:hypothetical protein ABT301_09370 [Streptomyces sp. NPDC000987]|uniref:hypothetical protein n=1 Tax=Streptomyces sp. NPDC000987 TaxID=3154374 RepID=UPI0033246B2A
MAAAGQDTAYPMDSTSPIPSLNDVSVHGFPKFDTSVPDVHLWTKPYPGEKKIYAPQHVPGAFIPSAENDG